MDKIKVELFQINCGQDWKSIPFAPPPSPPYYYPQPLGNLENQSTEFEKY